MRVQGTLLVMGCLLSATPFRSYGAWREGGVEQGCLKSRFLRQWGCPIGNGQAVWGQPCFGGVVPFKRYAALAPSLSSFGHTACAVCVALAPCFFLAVIHYDS